MDIEVLADRYQEEQEILKQIVDELVENGEDINIFTDLDEGEDDNLPI